MFLGSLVSMIGNKKIGGLGTAKPNKKDLLLLKDLLEAGKIKPFIDRRYSLREVPDAISYIEEGHARGKVIINIGNSSN
jgi:NADPH:quinone reductase-like Zn-dependent oxidoreductase